MKKKINSIQDLAYKTQYLSNALTKISHKGLELYCITRIWHLLNDLAIEPVFQQPVSFPNGKRALIDIYFPQIKLAIEINEPYHKKQEDKDRIRNKNIVHLTKSHIRKIDCTKSLTNIHQQIDKLVADIKRTIMKKKENQEGQPWSNKTPSFFINKGFFSCTSEDFLRTIDDFYKIIGLKQRKRGYQPEKYGTQPTKEGYYPWFPKTQQTKKDNPWINEISRDGKYIYEYHANEIKNHEHIKEIIKDNHTRLAFLETMDFLGNRGYYFKGIYKLNLLKTKRTKRGVWQQFSKEYKFQRG